MNSLLEEVVIDASKTKQVAQDLRTLDLSAIDNRVLKTYQDPKTIDQLREETIRFMSISAIGNGLYAPSQVVDLYWHEFILNTKLYESASKRIGKFVHHNPSERQEHELYQRTLDAYRQVFGEPSSKFWPAGDAADCSGGDCSSYCDGGNCTD